MRYLCLGLSILTVGLAGCADSIGGPNRPPHAEAGPDIGILMGQTATLDGTGSVDPDGDTLAFSWRLLAAPPSAFSGGALQQGPEAELPAGLARLTPTREGLWLVGLQVSDGRAESDLDTVAVAVAGQSCESDEECDNHLACDGLERCVDLRCRSGTPVDCSSLDGVCVVGACREPAGSCGVANREDGTGCDDGLFCTVRDACTSGVCTGEARECASLNPCLEGFCDEDKKSCDTRARQEGAACEDGKYCTVNETCQQGQCQGGTPRDCSAAGGACVDGSCDESQQRCVGDPLPDGALCNDEDRCTENDACGGGVCSGTPIDCSALADDCHTAFCDGATGECRVDPLTDGTPCQTGLFCVQGKTCQSGVCQGGTLRDCSSLADYCNAGVCDEGLRDCRKQPDREGDACQDGLFCTMAEVCDDGLCTHGIPRTCPPSDVPCRETFCSESLGGCDVRIAPDGAVCDDPSRCATGGVCQAGVCVGGTDTCPLGCNTSVQPARCNHLDVSNLGQVPLCQVGLPVFQGAPGVTVTFDTGTGQIDGQAVPNFLAVPQADPDAPELGVFAFNSFSLPATAILRVQGSRALVLLSCGPVDIQGVIRATASGRTPGPGGFLGAAAAYEAINAGQGYEAGAGGAGRREESYPYRQSGGGGGGFGAAGGKGGDGVNGGDRLAGGSAGQPNGTPELIPLLGGSGGGGGGSFATSAPGGGGGGAVQVSSESTITIGPQGGIWVGGGGGGLSSANNYGAGGGGGAGGGILLEAALVEVQGTLAANGGGGGGGRTEYTPWGHYCSSNTPQPGQAGLFSDERAQGGADCSGTGTAPDAGEGGDGGASVFFAGDAGQDEGVGGGGAGGVGRIRLNSRNGTQVNLTGISSPACGAQNSPCTTGAVSIW
ncbi:MAG: hypothetical protein GYA21_09215 [Myxococcales bacterium]|nr:hypothetical protein [Myxococcales bacterium]